MSLHEFVERFVSQLPPVLSIERACEAGSFRRTLLSALVGDGCIRALKSRDKTLIDTRSLLDYLASLPEAKINPPARPNQAGRRRSAQPPPQPAPPASYRSRKPAAAT